VALVVGTMAWVEVVTSSHNGHMGKKAVASDGHVEVEHLPKHIWLGVPHPTDPLVDQHDEDQMLIELEHQPNFRVPICPKVQMVFHGVTHFLPPWRFQPNVEDLD